MGTGTDRERNETSGPASITTGGIVNPRMKISQNSNIDVNMVGLTKGDGRSLNSRVETKQMKIMGTNAHATGNLKPELSEKLLDSVEGVALK